MHCIVFFKLRKILFVVECEPGEMNDGEKCTKCPRGTYQPDRGKTACIDCPLNHTTRDVGSTRADDCKCTYNIEHSIPVIFALFITTIITLYI